MACSPATRKRGQAALQAARASSGATGRARKNPAPAPTPPPKKTTAPKTRRRANPAPAVEAPRQRAAPCRCPHLPSPLSSGEYVVLLATSGGRLQPVKTFRTLRDAEGFLASAGGARAVVARVVSTWGA